MTVNLFNLDFSRWEVVLLSLLPAMINIGLFFYVSFRLPQNRTNYAFSGFVLLSGLWQLGDGFVRISVDHATAIEWYRIALAFSLFVIPFGILFTLRSSADLWPRTNRFMILSQYIPAIICLIAMLSRQDEYTVEPSHYWYWIVSPVPTNVVLSIYSWLIFNAVLLLVLLWHNFARSNRHQRNQSLLFAVGFTLPIVGSIVFSAIFPVIFGLDYIPVTTPLVTAFTIAAFVSIKNNDLLDYSPRHQWGQIVETMNEGLLIVNNKDEIMYANQKFCELMEYDFAEIKGKVAGKLLFDNSEYERREKVRAGINNASGQYEGLLKTRSGKRIWMIINSTPYVDSKGNIMGSIGIHTNIDSSKRSDARFRALVENIGDLISLSDKNGTVIYDSPALEKITGFTVEEMEGKPLYELIHPEHIGETERILKLVLENPGVPFPRINRFKHKDGHYVWVEGMITNLLENEDVNAIVSSYHDITERREAEQKILQKDERLSAILDNEPECVKVADIQGRLLEMNPAGLKMLEVESLDAVLGRNLADLVHPDDRQIYLDLHERVCKGESGTADYRFIGFNKTQRWLESNSVPLRNANGEIYAALTVARDITEIKKKNDELVRVKNELEYSESRLKQAQAIAHVGNWELNFASGISIWSDEACRIYGLDPDDNSRTLNEWMKMIHPDDLEEMEKEIKENWLLHRDFSFNHRIVRRSGEVRYVNLESRFEFDDNANAIGLYGVVHDVTEEKEAELRLQNLLNVTNDQNARLQNFAYIISHNIRSHSANIIGLVDVMGVARNKEEGDKVFGMLKQSTDKLSETIENLNDIITIQNDINRQKIRLQLKEEVDKTANAINSILLQSKTTMVNDISDDLMLHTVPSYLESILLNLMTNAVKYSSPERQPLVHISAERNNGWLEIRIRDNGLGIDLKKNGNKIFGMYKTFHDNEDATGFGLYITKNQVEAMGGRIEVESEPGKGSTFKVFLHE